MKRLLLSFVTLLAIIGTVTADTKVPIMLTGGHQDAFTLEEACDVEPLPGSTMEALYGATFTPKNNFTNLFQYKNMEVGSYEKIVIKFGAPVPEGYNLNDNSGFKSIAGLTECEIVLDGTPISDFTIFNWEGCYAPITITEVYFWTSKTVVDKPKAKGKWVSLISNGDAEGTGLESFPVSFDGPNNGGTANDEAEIVAGEGYDGTKAIKVTSFDTPSETWHTQFFLLFNEELAEGTKIRLSLNHRADFDQKITASAQGNPRDYNGNLDIEFTPTSDWDYYEWTHTVTSGDAGNNGFKSIAFNLNEGDNHPNTFYFDNIVLEKYVPSIGADFGSTAAQIIFPYETNIASLVEAGGKSRLQVPAESVTMTVNGKAVGIDYVEYDLNGSIYVFPSEDVVMEETDKVVVTFTNPADEAIHVAYTEDGHKDEAIESVETEAEWNDKVSEVMPFNYGEPVLDSADPENGSFNLSNTISEFTLTFDKPVDCAKLTAKIGKEKLTNTPASGMSKVVKLTRTGADLSNGKITINVTNVWGEFTPEDFAYQNDFDLSYGIGVVDSEDPNAIGVMQIRNLLTALENAKGTLDNAEEDMYQGSCRDALDAKIQQYDGQEYVMTAPSQFDNAIRELNAAAKAMNDHIALCDDYSAQVVKASTIYLNNKDSKFKATELFKALETAVRKYCTFGTEIQYDEVTDEEKTVEVLESFKMLYDDEELTAAKNEMTTPVNVAEQYFTEVALNADIQQGNCGVAVLVERNRLGARTLLSLGVDESDPLIEAAKNSITDDDDLAGQIKKRIAMELYSQLKEADNEVFAPVVDEYGDPVTDAQGNPVNKSYDMTVFIKNPNIYCVDGTQGLSEENVPGWTYPEQYSKPGLFKKWNEQRDIAGLPEDCAFETWYGTCRMEQTITDLPAGIYVVSLCGSDWSNKAGQENNPYDLKGFVYCKTSETIDPEEGEEEDRDLNFAATRTIVYGGQWNMDHAHNLGYNEVFDDATGFVSTTEDGEFFGIPVTDGQLTLGIHFGGDAQIFFQHARLTLMAPADINYADTYQEFISGVDAAKTAKVRAIEVYDLNGHRLVNAKKGISIVRKLMSDGTVKTSKVVK